MANVDDEIFSQLSATLTPKLSPEAGVFETRTSEDLKAVFTPWTNHNLQTPTAVVKVRTEQDVVETVKYAIKNSIKIVAKAGGHSIFNSVGKGGIIVDMTDFNGIKLDTETLNMTIQGGAVAMDAIEAAYKAGRCVVAGSSNTIGVIPLTLGGGIGPLASLYGLVIDNLVSVRIVTAAGILITASPSENADLFWALQGAGQKFGFVTEITLKTYPLSSLGAEDGTCWYGTYIFDGERVGELGDVFGGMKWGRGMVGSLVFAAPEGKPVLSLTLFYFGSTSEALATYAPLTALNPKVSGSARTPYNDMNTYEGPACETGGYKRMYGASITTLPGVAVAEAFELYREYMETMGPEAGKSVVIFYTVGMEAARSRGKGDGENVGGCFSMREAQYWMIVIPWPNSPPSHNTNAIIDTYARKTREVLRARDIDPTTGRPRAPTLYCNNSMESDKLEEMYDERSLERLRKLKSIWDAEGVFGGKF